MERIYVIVTSMCVEKVYVTICKKNKERGLGNKLCGEVWTEQSVYKSKGVLLK